MGFLPASGGLFQCARRPFLDGCYTDLAADMRTLFWLYLINSILLINHEIDSAYWKEWELFKLPGGINGFLIIHFPLLFLVLYGLVLVNRGIFAGLIFSLILSIGGLFAFGIHSYFIKKGHRQFTTIISRLILTATMITSIFQGGLTTYLLLNYG